MNRILVPLNNRERIKDYTSVGADEFYMGFYDNAWIEKCGEYSEINRMSGFRDYANRYQFNEILDIVKAVKDCDKAAYVTINSAIYSQHELNVLHEYFDRIHHAGADGVIVSTPELVKMAIEHKLNPVASTMCGIYNNDIVSFYKDLGANRMIVPRDLSYSEIEDMVNQNPTVEFEVFLMRNGCQFSDSHCLGFHRPECGSMCGTLNGGNVHLNSVVGDDFKSRHDIELNNMIYRGLWHKRASCGMCALYRFVNLNIAAYKIVGRADNENEVMRDIQLVRYNIEVAKSSATEDEYLKKMQLLDRSFDGCKLGMGCYYPEIRF